MHVRDLTELLDALMDAVIEITNADKGFLILLEGETLDVKVARNLNRENIADAISQLSRLDHRQGRAIAAAGDRLRRDARRRVRGREERHAPQGVVGDLRAAARPRPAARPHLRRQRLDPRSVPGPDAARAHRVRVAGRADRRERAAAQRAARRQQAAARAPRAVSLRRDRRHVAADAAGVPQGREDRADRHLRC